MQNDNEDRPAVVQLKSVRAQDRYGFLAHIYSVDGPVDNDPRRSFEIIDP